MIPLLQADRHRYMKVKGISAECRNLLAHMFRANPADRATMADIMGHPWFRKDCPQVRPPAVISPIAAREVQQLVSQSSPQLLTESMQSGFQSGCYEIVLI